MFKIKVEGVSGVLKGLKDIGEQMLDDRPTNSIVRDGGDEAQKALINNYVAGNHNKTGYFIKSLVNFKGKKWRGTGYYAYFVGPKKGNEGNVAYWLEDGTVDRFRSDASKGGVSLRFGKSIYGAKARTGKVKPYKIVQKTRDEAGPGIIERMTSRLQKRINKIIKEKGF
tara:strand:+ start:746 stop:1252 length:507 start_codon:yes stop_codon:yes gene_type:complete